MAYLRTLAISLFKEKAGQVHKAYTLRGLQAITSRIAFLAHGVLMRVIMQVMLVRLVAVPKVHHLSPVLIG